MRKLIYGIVEFRERELPRYAERFRDLAFAHSPDTLMITCSDSRVVPDMLASTHPGDLFTMRNVGNLIPPATAEGISIGDVSEASAIEYAVLVLKVGNIVVCGHSECGAMKAVLARKAGLLNERGVPYKPKSIKAMQRGIRPRRDEQLAAQMKGSRRDVHAHDGVGHQVLDLHQHVELRQLVVWLQRRFQRALVFELKCRRAGRSNQGLDIDRPPIGQGGTERNDENAGGVFDCGAAAFALLSNNTGLADRHALGFRIQHEREFRQWLLGLAPDALLGFL